MPSISRRALLAGTCVMLSSVAGCTSLLRSSTDSSQEDSNPHWVKTYLGDRAETYNVTVTIINQDGATVFERDYQLSDSNEADEDATFPASTEPETIVVTVDGDRFEREWPGFEHTKLPCNGPNEAGIEIYVENTKEGKPDIRLEADCQSIRVE